MEKAMLVFQTDFSYKEGAVCSMYGVVKSVDRSLEIITGSHELPRFDTWSASYRLCQSMKFWPRGTVFVSVVDPGVGTPRKASVALTENGYYIVTPDNGSLTHVDAEFGIKQIRQIDESVNRLRGKDTEEVSIFHGRDLFAYCAARLASGMIDFEGVGPAYPLSELVRHPIAAAEITEKGIRGIFEIDDPNFGNLWTNISLHDFRQTGFEFGDRVNLRICENGEERFNENLLFEKSFGFAPAGEPVIYNNELMRISLAVSQGSFSDTFRIGYGSAWSVEFSK